MNTQHAPAAPAVDRLVGVEEVAERFGVAPKTVRRYADAGILPAVRLMPGARLRFRVRDVEAAIEAGLTTKEAPS